MIPTFNIVLDKRKGSLNKDGLSPAKLQVIFNRDYRFYSIGSLLHVGNKDLFFNPEKTIKVTNKHEKGYEYINEFEKIQRGTYLTPEQDNIFNLFNDCINKAKAIESQMTVFSFDEFKKRLPEKAANQDDILTTLLNTENELLKEGRPGTSDTFKYTRKSLINYIALRNKTELKFIDVTPTFLNDFEKYMLNEGKSLTTIGMYLRNVRTVFNRAIKNPLSNVNTNNYPFGSADSKYNIPTGENVKKALSFENVLKIMDYKPYPGSNEHKYRDLWVFSYLCAGMNIADIVRLKYENIENNTINFVREKTKRTTKNKQKTISIPLSKEAKKIIDYWGLKPVYDSSYIFDVIKEKQDPQKQLNLVRQLIKNINDNIDRIAKKLGIEEKVTTYSARHSFATIMMKSNSPLTLISEVLGHKSIKTTQNYLGSFNSDEKATYFKNLTSNK